MMKMMDWRRCAFLMLALAGLQPLVCSAQDEAVKSAVARYPDDHAVVWSMDERIRIEEDNGVLKARSNKVEEILLLDEQAVPLLNTGSIYHSFFHKLEGWTAATLVPQGDRYKEVKATQSKTNSSADESVFYDDAQETQVTFGNLSKFSRTHLEYTILHTDMHFLPGFYFQSHMPIRKASFEVTVPNNVTLGYLLQGQNQQWIRMTKEQGRRETVYTWKVQDVPKARHYSDGPDVPFYVPHLLIYIADYTPRHAKTATRVFSKPGDLYNYYYPFIRNINKERNAPLEHMVDSIISGAASPRDKAARIYNWVQHNIRYIAFEDGLGGFIPREAASICARRYGDCKDMSSLLVAMCRYAGLDAYFTWIGTRSKPYTYGDVPLPIVDNHMIGALKLNDEFLFMDGTDPMIPFGIPPYNIQGKEALIAIDSGKYQVVKLPEIDAGRNTFEDTTYIAIEGTLIKGTVDIHFTGYPAWNIAIGLQYRSEEEKKLAVKAQVSRGSDNYVQKNFSFAAASTPGKELALHSDFTIDGYARKAGKEWYVNLNMARHFGDEFADTAERRVPIVFRYKSTTREVINMDIPAGYKVDYLPPSSAEDVPGLWSYKISYRKTDRQVQLVKEYRLYTLAIAPAQFPDHNRMVDALRREYKESVVLKALP